MAELDDRAHMKVQTFSGGMRRKLEIVRAFIHHPLILFLDEPTIGLDPDARHEVWQQIAKLNEEKTSIILTTHYMDEAEKLCNRIAFMDKGRLIALDVLENLKRLIPSGDLIEIGFDIIDERILQALKETSLINSAVIKEQRVIISAKNGSTVLPEIVAVFEKFSTPMTSISIRSPSLEDVFIHLTGKKLDNGGQPETKPVRGQRPL
jgi:ABC-2 type transport system ATP-binding protein